MARLILLLLLLASPVAEAACPRIVSQSPYITQALEWLGLRACIVGVSRYEDDAGRNLPRTGGIIDPDADAIALLEPQLLITSDWTTAEAWQAATPPGAQALRVGGFRAMAEVEAMLRDIGHAAGVADIDARVDRFAADWRAAAAGVGGDGRRVLLLSACGAVPYSFGRRTHLHDLFVAAGFVPVESHETLRHLRPNEPIATIPQLVAATRPDLVVAFVNHQSESCNALLGEAGVPVVAIDGEKFMHPGPALLDALAQLKQALKPWPRTRMRATPRACSARRRWSMKRSPRPAPSAASSSSTPATARASPRPPSACSPAPSATA
jgi:iron complex transport system substrate-binding protein